jgi:uncharacterized protein (TIGR00251 family)
MTAIDLPASGVVNDTVWWTRTDTGIELRVRVSPGARRSAVMSVGRDHIRIRLAARAVDGQANAELLSFVADVCGVRKSAVRIRRGLRSRVKTVAIVGFDTPPRELLARAVEG